MSIKTMCGRLQLFVFFVLISASMSGKSGHAAPTAPAAPVGPTSLPTCHDICNDLARQFVAGRVLSIAERDLVNQCPLSLEEKLEARQQPTGWNPGFSVDREKSKDLGLLQAQSEALKECTAKLAAEPRRKP